VTWVAVLDDGDELISEISPWIGKECVAAASITGVAGFREATLAYCDTDSHSDEDIPVKEQVELLTLAGDITTGPDGYQLHAHAVCGRRDGSSIGGHFPSGCPPHPGACDHPSPELFTTAATTPALALLQSISTPDFWEEGQRQHASGLGRNSHQTGPRPEMASRVLSRGATSTLVSRAPTPVATACRCGLVGALARADSSRTPRSTNSSRVIRAASAGNTSASSCFMCERTAVTS